MATIVTRSGKGSPLTNNEVDANFTNLNTELGTKADTSSLATVATTGAYADLTGKPTLVDASNVAITGGSITGTTIDSITNHVGADHIHYKIKATQILAKGDVVKVVGFNAGENAFEVAKVSASTDIAVGVVYSALANGELGSIINTGLLEGIDTSAFAIGTTLYPNTTGGFTSTKPTSGRYQALAFVVRSSANNGTILIEASEPQATSLSQFTNDSGYLTSFTESDPTVPSHVKAITTTKISNWDTAFGWGNHASAGYLTGITSGQVTTALGYTPYNASNPAGYTTNTGTVTSVGGTGTVSGLTLSGTVTGSGNLTLGGALSLTSGNVTTALGFTPYNATNPSGYITSAALSAYQPLDGDLTAIAALAGTTGFVKKTAANTYTLDTATYLTGITSGNVTTALGYTPANRAGDNFTGAVGFLGGSAVASNGDFYARRDSGSTGVYYFAAGVDKYLYWDGSSYNFGGAGPVIAPTSFRAPIFYDSANTGYYVDAASTSNLNAANFNGAVNLDGGTTIWTGSTGLRLKRNTTSATGDDVLDIQIFDGEARHTLDNDNDGDSSLFTFGHMANGARVQTLAFDDVNVSWKGQKIFHDGYHPEADKWTTARTLSLSGDATGSVSWDGSANVTLSTTVVNDSHEHSFNSLINKTGGTGTYTTSGDFRAPIFYDSNNTAFYVDPASTSNLSALNVNGSAVYRSDWTTRFQSGSDFVDGTLVTTDIPATATNGDSFVIEITGKSYDGSNPPFKVVAQGYLYNDTIINYSGLSYAGNFASYIKVFQDGGVLKFWWPRISYWNSFNVNVMTMDGPSNNTITRNRVTAIANSTEPTGTKKQQINLKGFMRNDVSATNSVDLRAPIFYDSNNTGFYLDPNGTSNLSGLTVANTITGSVSGSSGSTTGNAATATTLQNARTINGVSFNGSANITITAAANGGNAATATTVSSITDITGLGRNSLSAGVVDGLTTTNFRTTMFGKNDSTYNIATSRWNGVPTAFGGLAAYGTAISWSGLDTHAFLALNYNSAGAKIGGGSGNNINWSADLLHSANYTSYAMPSGSSATNSVDVRAPIFYDSNDTSYYVNPNSSSVLNTLYMRNGTVQAKFAQASNFGYSSSYKTVVLGNEYLTTISMGVDVSGNASGSFNGQGEGREVLFRNGVAFITPNAANTAYETPLILLNGYASSVGSFRAPIFYDSNNTAYYLNPESTSVLWEAATYYLRNIEDVAVNHEYGLYFSNSRSTAYAIYREAGAWTHPYPDLRIAFHTGIKMGAAAGYGGMKFYTDYDMSSQVMSINNGADGVGGGNVFVNNVLVAAGDIRSQIFYDYNNTGYYLDASSTGTSLNVAGSIIAAGNVTAYSDRRLKNNIQQMTSALDKVSQLLGVTFTRNDLADTTRRYGGLLAQDVEKVLPEAVHDIGGTLGVDYNATIGLLVEAIKELRDEVEMLRK